MESREGFWGEAKHRISAVGLGGSIHQNWEIGEDYCHLTFSSYNEQRNFIVILKSILSPYLRTEAVCKLICLI